MDGSLWEEDDVEEERKEVNDETETGGRGPSEVGQMEVDDKYEVKVETKVASQGVKSHGEKNGNGGMETSEVLVKRKMRRRKWVATGEEVVEAFEFITRVKYESPTRLMGESHWRSMSLKKRVGVLSESGRGGADRLVKVRRWYLADLIPSMVLLLRCPLVSHSHCVLVRTHPRRYHLENPFTLFRYYPSCCRYEPHQGTSSRRHGAFERKGRRHPRRIGTT